MGRKGISPLIASVFVILFSVTILGISLGVINPTFNRAKDTAIVNDAFHTLETLNTAIKEVASEPDGSKRVVPIVVSEGTLRVNTTYDWLYFDYDPMEPMTISGTKGDIHIVRGLEFADWFNYYADGSVATPTWTNTSGQAVISSGAYSITNGTSYHNVSGPLENWKFSATISNISGSTGGQVFVLPTNPESLVGFWPFDNRSGSVAYDYSGNHNNGTLIYMNTTGNATSGWTTDAKFGTALKFDGFDDYVSSANPVLVPSGFTFLCWWKRSGDSGGATTNTYHQIMRNLNGGGVNNQLLVNRAGTSTVSQVLTDGVARTGTAVAINPSIWNHIGSTWNGTHLMTITNGALATPVAAPGVLGTGTNNMLIGWRDAVNLISNGTIDEVMIFNRSLSADEVTALYETSSKKLTSTGTQTVTTKVTPAIVMSNPAGRTSFDDVTVTRDRNELRMIVPYTNVDLNGTLRLVKGEHKVQIRHMETNATTSRPIVELTPI